MNNSLSRLGLGPQPFDYLPGLAQAPPPAHPTMRRNIARNFTPPTHRQNPAEVQRAGAVIGGLASALAQLDHFARQLQGMGQMKYETKHKLKQLINLSDEVLAAAAGQFDSQDADAIMALSAVLGQSAELLLQLKPAQIESALKHQHAMAINNLNYTPAAV